jgi:streptogrisin D
VRRRSEQDGRRTAAAVDQADASHPLFAGTVALGLTSGGSGSCTRGGTTFLRPVTEPLSVSGVTVY